MWKHSSLNTVGWHRRESLKAHRRGVRFLEALAVDDGRARLVVFGLGDPHLLEGGEGREDGAANPHRVLAFRRGNNLDLHGGRSKSSQLLGHALADALEHGGAAREDNVRVEPM